MQPHLTSSVRGTPVRSKTGSPSSSGTIACRTTTKHPSMLVSRRCGDRANYFTQELDTEITSITTTSTELHTPDIKMIDFDQMAYSLLSSETMDSMHQHQVAGTSETAIFDVQSGSSVDSGRGLLSPNTSNIAHSVVPSGKPTLPMGASFASLVDSDLSSLGSSHSVSQCVSGMEESVLPFERPVSPSEFLQKNPAPSSELPSQDSEMFPDLRNDIEQLLGNNSVDMSWDCIHQLDLNLFNLPVDQEELDLNLVCPPVDQKDTLNSIVSECGILDEMEESHTICGDVPKISEESPNNHHEGCGSEVIEEASVHCEGANLAVPKPVEIQQSSCVGPLRTRHTRRDRRKPVRYLETQSLDDEPAITEVTVKVDMENLVASTSGTTFTRRKNDKRELSNEEKYIRSREQNNIASKRCREKRKESVRKMETELKELETKNRDLKDRVAYLTSLRNEFKDFVNKFLFQKIAQKGI